jgi:hypothetical protein
MANLHALRNDRTRAAESDVDILGKLDYWRALLHERGLHTEAMVMARAASEIRVLRGIVSDRMTQVGCAPAAARKAKSARQPD